MSADAIGISAVILLGGYLLGLVLERLAKKASADRAEIVAALNRVASKQDSHMRQLGEIYAAIKGPESYL